MVLYYELIAIGISFLWLLLITILFWQLSTHYNNLTKGTSSKALKTVLEEILKNIAVAQKDIDVLKSRYDTIEKDGIFHIQKIGLLRFNPFKDTGGDQSFILALLDKNDTGVVISSLYARSGTRWYAKNVLNGKATEHQLSDEEKKAIKEAKVAA